MCTRLFYRGNVGSIFLSQYVTQVPHCTVFTLRKSFFLTLAAMTISYISFKLPEIKYQFFLCLVIDTLYDNWKSKCPVFVRRQFNSSLYDR
jgi:hypothetical protein